MLLLYQLLMVLYVILFRANILIIDLNIMSYNIYILLYINIKNPGIQSDVIISLNIIINNWEKFIGWWKVSSINKFLDLLAFSIILSLVQIKY